VSGGRVPFAFIALAALAGGVRAELAEDLARCRDIVEANERLRCYDTLVPAPAPATLPEPPKPRSLERDDPRSALVATGKTEQGRSLLSQRWELDREDKYGTFQFTYYRPNYILPAIWSTDVNRAPQSPTRGTPPVEIPYQYTEGSFQLSFKIKMVEGVFGSPSDIWIGYTQQSYWQVYNADLSRPFRESNYEPEAMWVVPLDADVLGLRARLLSFGIAHQSNGRAEPLSRSWNRVYAMVGLERGRFVLQAKAWRRLSESGFDDDNPDLVDYVGRGEVLGFYQLEGGGRRRCGCARRSRAIRAGARRSSTGVSRFPGSCSGTCRSSVDTASR
jgi:phospholipase A1